MTRRGRSLLALVPTLTVGLLGGVWQARAEPVPAMVAQQTPQQAPPTTSVLDGLLQALFPTTTTTAPAAAPAPAAPASAEPEAGSGSTDSSPDTSTPGDRTIPPEAQAIINSVLRTGSNNTTALLAALRPLTDAGMTEEEAALIGFGQFPVAGEAWWTDDWLDARFTPEFHFHHGTDIFAARGTPVRAPADGMLEFSNGGAGGLGAWVHSSGDGTLYYMAHLDKFASDKSSGMRVKQGDVVGFVGSSGNAEGGSPHVHLQIHPGGGAPINPKPIVDRWLAEAIRNVPTLLPKYDVGLPRPITAAGLLRRLDTGSLGAPMDSDGPQLWATSVRRENGAIKLATSSTADAPAPWDPRVRGAAARAKERLRAEQLASDVLAPLTPRVLEEVRVGGGGGGG